jgi:VanZ family protein
MPIEPTAHHPPSRWRRVLVASAFLVGVAALVWVADQPRYKSILALTRRLPGRDKGAHFLAMGGLSFALNYALRCRRWKIFGERLLVGTLLALVLTVVEEGSQAYLPGRVFDMDDLGAAGLGAILCGWVTAQLFQRGYFRIPTAQNRG